MMIKFIRNLIRIKKFRALIKRENINQVKDGVLVSNRDTEKIMIMAGGCWRVVQKKEFDEIFSKNAIGGRIVIPRLTSLQIKLLEGSGGDQ